MRFARQAAGVALCLVVGATGAIGQTPGQTQQDGEAPLIPTNAITLEGLPTVRLDATQDGVLRRELGGADATREGLKVRVVDGRYYWASRENRPLTLSASGEFTYLASAEPGRYVRLRRVNDRIDYVEHVDMPAGSVTYWGELRIVLGK